MYVNVIHLGDHTRDSVLYVGLTGTVQTLIQKSIGMDMPLFPLFMRLARILEEQ